jgi:hypothetical protein
MARRRTKSREIDPANRSAKHPCKTAIQLLPHGSTKRSIKRAIPHNAAGNSGMTGNTDIPRCCPFGSGSRASVSRVWRVAARAHRTHTTVIHSSNRTERISASPFRRTCIYTVCITTLACVLTHLGAGGKISIKSLARHSLRRDFARHRRCLAGAQCSISLLRQGRQFERSTAFSEPTPADSASLRFFPPPPACPSGNGA